MAEYCSCGNSRSFSWLVKSCLPDPTATHPVPRRVVDPGPPLLHPCPPASKARPPPSSRERRHRHDPTAPSLSYLPDDLLLECLSRVPLSSLPSVSLVCHHFSHLLDSPAFSQLRRSHGLLRRTLFVLSLSDEGFALVLSSWGSPEPPLLLPLPAETLEGCFSHPRLVPVGRYIFVLGRNASFCYDTWRGTAAPTSPTLFPRKKFAAASVAGKIYVAGGSARTSAVEEYDPVNDAWRVVAEAPRRRYGCVGASAGGVFYLIGGLKVGGSGRGEATTWTCAGTMDLYDVEARTWLRSRAVPGGGCVVGACAAGGHVYVLASHAVELSFWRWEGEAAAGKGRMKSLGGGFDWARLPPPPVPQQARVGGAGRFACVGVGESLVVLLVHVAASSDAAGRGGSCDKEGLMLVYDAWAGEWSRGTNPPAAVWRAACVCVEC